MDMGDDSDEQSNKNRFASRNSKCLGGGGEVDGGVKVCLICLLIYRRLA